MAEKEEKKLTELQEVLKHLAKWLNNHMTGSRNAHYGPEKTEKQVELGTGFVIGSFGGFGMGGDYDTITVNLFKNRLGTIKLGKNDTGGPIFVLDHADKSEFHDEISVADPDSFEMVLEVIEKWPVVNFNFGIDKWE